MDPQGQLGKVLGLDIHRTQRSAIDLLLDSVLGDAGLDGRAPCAEPGRHPASLLPITSTRIPRLDVVLANKSLALFPSWDGGEESDATGRLARTLDAAAELSAYEFIFFDAPPSFGPLTLSLLRAAQEIVLPVPLTFLALDGCAELLRTVETVRTRYGNPSLRLSMVVP